MTYGEAEHLKLEIRILILFNICPLSLMLSVWSVTQSARYASSGLFLILSAIQSFQISPRKEVDLG